MVINMNHVLYEASFQFHPFLLIPIFLMIIYIVRNSFILKQKNKLNDNKYHKNNKLDKNSRMIGVAFFAIASLEVLLGQIHMYNKIVRAYRQGKYQVVEGYHNAKSHGGVITGNGHHLKIGYVYYNSAMGNIIVYIEELD